MTYRTPSFKHHREVLVRPDGMLSLHPQKTPRLHAILAHSLERWLDVGMADPRSNGFWSFLKRVRMAQKYTSDMFIPELV